MGVKNEGKSLLPTYVDDKEHRGPPGICTINNILNGIFLISCPLVMIIIGGVYIDECRVDKRIPISLIVQGIGFLSINILYSRELLQRRDSRTYLFVVTSAFILMWFIFGTILTYRAYEPNFNRSAELYCHETLYKFAFWINTMYVIVIVFLLCLYIRRETNR